MRVYTCTQQALSVDWDEFCVRIGSHAESIKQKSSLCAFFIHLIHTNTLTNDYMDCGVIRSKTKCWVMVGGVLAVGHEVQCKEKGLKWDFLGE